MLNYIKKKKIVSVTASNQKLIFDIESYSNRKFNYPDVILDIFDCSVEYGLQWELSDIIFTAKFLHNALKSIKRTDQPENRDKLLLEYQAKIEKMKQDLEFICSRLSEEKRIFFRTTLLQNRQDSFANLHKFIEDLSWVKNYEIDNNTKIGNLLTKN
ncbi:MAG: hypothetical protein Q8K98_14625 [Bacteroidota bacterium]|nr:hypothetical protein [Bacteroidota bacterium]